MSDSSLDIVVPCYGNLDLSTRALAALTLFKPPGSRIILVNNGSAPESGVSSLAKPVQAGGGLYLHLKTNRGPYAAFNAGIQASRAQKIAFMGNDVVPFPDTLELMSLAVSDAVPIISACEVRIPSPDLNFPALMRAAISAATGLKPELGTGFSLIMMQRSLFEEDRVGLFDERFHLVFGDTDWDVRRTDLGLRAVKIPALMYHGCSVTRKRGGAAADVDFEISDHGKFLAKYASRPEVLRQHPYAGTCSQKIAVTEQCWSTGEK